MDEIGLMNLPVEPDNVEEDIRREYAENKDIKRLSKRYCMTAAEIRKILQINRTNVR